MPRTKRRLCASRKRVTGAATTPRRPARTATTPIAFPIETPMPRRFDPTRSPRWTTRTPSTGARFAGWCARWVRRRRWPRPRPRSWSWCGRSARTPCRTRGARSPDWTSTPPWRRTRASRGRPPAVRSRAHSLPCGVHPAARGWRMPRRASARARRGMLNHPRLRFTWTTTPTGRTRLCSRASPNPRRTRRWASTSRSSSPWRRTRGASSSRATPRSSSCPRCPRPSPRPPGRSARGRASTRRRSARRRSRRRGGRRISPRAGARTTRCSNRRAATRSSCPRPRRATRRARARALAKEKAKNAAAGRCWPTPGTRCSPRGSSRSTTGWSRSPSARTRGAPWSKPRRRPRCPQRRARRRTPPRRRAPPPRSAPGPPRRRPGASRGDGPARRDSARKRGRLVLLSPRSGMAPRRYPPAPTLV